MRVLPNKSTQIFYEFNSNYVGASQPIARDTLAVRANRVVLDTLARRSQDSR
jgi:hypothetical protein